MDAFQTMLTEYMTVWTAKYKSKLLPKIRKQVTCSICKESGHNKRTCVYTCIYKTLDIMPKDVINIIYDMKVSAEEYSRKCEYDRKQNAYKKDCDIAQKAYDDFISDLFDVVDDNPILQVSDHLVNTNTNHYNDQDNMNMDYYAFQLFTHDYRLLCLKFSHKFKDDSYYVDIFNKLKNCKCCGFHMSHKPKHILDYQFVNDIRLRDEPFYVDKCICQCRHYARNIVVLNKLRTVYI